MRPGDRPWLDFAPDVEPRTPQRRYGVEALVESDPPRPQRNPLAVAFDIGLLMLVLVVVLLGYLGRLDWLLDFVDFVQR